MYWPADAVLDEGVAESEGGRPEGIGNGGVDRLVVAAVVAARLQAQLEYLQHPGQISQLCTRLNNWFLWRTEIKSIKLFCAPLKQEIPKSIYYDLVTWIKDSFNFF